MGPHDYITSELIRMKKLLEQYVDEFDPPGGAKALKHIQLLIMTVDIFPSNKEE